MHADPLNERLESLVRELPLPQGWVAPSLFCEDADLRGFAVRMIGLSSRRADGLEIVGSAAGTDPGLLERAFYELIERISVVEAESSGKALELLDFGGGLIRRISASEAFPASPSPGEWVYSKSNGVAAGTRFQDAALGAARELVERDRVLDRWYRQAPPEPLRLEPGFAPESLKAIYELEAFSMGTRRACGREIEAAALFAFPREDAEGAVIAGFGAGLSRREALAAARKETIQRIAFLWGEGVSEEPLGFSPTPLFHQEFFLAPQGRGRIRSWLGARGPAPRAGESLNLGFVDLTPRHLSGRMAVVKAISDEIIPLTFGKGNPKVPRLRLELMIHPIA